MTRDELKELIDACLLELSEDTQAPITSSSAVAPNPADDINTTSEDDPTVKASQRKVELGKQDVERKRKKTIDVKLQAANKEKSGATDIDAKKMFDDKIKQLNQKKQASNAALNAAVKAASSIK